MLRTNILYKKQNPSDLEEAAPKATILMSAVAFIVLGFTGTAASPIVSAWFGDLSAFDFCMRVLLTIGYILGLVGLAFRFVIPPIMKRFKKPKPTDLKAVAPEIKPGETLSRWRLLVSF